MAVSKTQKITYQKQTTAGIVAIIALAICVPSLWNEHIPFYQRLGILTFFITIGASISVMWKYSLPEKEGFISKVLSCCKDGFLVMLICGLVFFLITWLFNITSNFFFISAVIISILLGVGGNKKIIRNGETIERTWLDAIVITLAQLVFVYTVVLVVAIIIHRVFGRTRS